MLRTDLDVFIDQKATVRGEANAHRVADFKTVVLMISILSDGPGMSDRVGFSFYCRNPQHATELMRTLRAAADALEQTLKSEEATVG